MPDETEDALDGNLANVSAFSVTPIASLNVYVINLSKVSSSKQTNQVLNHSNIPTHSASLHHLSFSLISFSFDGFR